MKEEKYTQPETAEAAEQKANEPQEEQPPKAMKKLSGGDLLQSILKDKNNRAAIKIQVEDKKEREAEEQNDIIIPTKIDTSDPDEVIKNLRTDNEANGNKEAEKACNCCIIF